MREADRQLIRALPLFSEMSEASFGELTGAAYLQRFPPGVVLMSEGALPDFLHVVVEGSVEMYCAHDGTETTIDILRPATTFILAAVIRDEVYLKSARTLTPAQILMIPAHTVRDVFGRDAAFARAVVKELAARYRSVVRALKNEKLRTGAERLANWILQAHTRQGDRHAVAMTFGKRTLAARLGMTPENLSRNLAVLGKYGVKSSGRDIIIEDLSVLERFAKPNALIDG